MPIYEYVCLECGARFDTLRSMKDADEPINCQSCSSDHTSRLLSLFFAQSSRGVLAGSSNGGCSGCTSGSCAGCGVR